MGLSLFLQAADGIRDGHVTGVQTCALPIYAEKKAASLQSQAEKMRAKATKAVAAQNMFRRAEKMLAETEGERRAERVANLRFPDPQPCGRVPLTAHELSKSYGSTEVFTGVDLDIDHG